MWRIYDHNYDPLGPNLKIIEVDIQWMKLAHMLVMSMNIHPPCNTWTLHIRSKLDYIQLLGEVIVVAYYKTIKVKKLEAFIGNKTLNTYLLV